MLYSCIGLQTNYSDCSPPLTLTLTLTFLTDCVHWRTRVNCNVKIRTSYVRLKCDNTYLTQAGVWSWEWGERGWLFVRLRAVLTSRWPRWTRWMRSRLRRLRRWGAMSFPPNVTSACFSGLGWKTWSTAASFPAWSGSTPARPCSRCRGSIEVRRTGRYDTAASSWSVSVFITVLFRQKQ